MKTFWTFYFFKVFYIMRPFKFVISLKLFTSFNSSNKTSYFNPIKYLISLTRTKTLVSKRVNGQDLMKGNLEHKLCKLHTFGILILNTKWKDRKSRKNWCTENFTYTKKCYVHEIAAVNLSKIYFLKNAKKRCKPNNGDLNRNWINKLVKVLLLKIA